MFERLAIRSIGLAAATAMLFSAGADAAGQRRAQPPKLSAAAQRGLAFAQLRCSACHGVTENRGSPNPESPPFEDIANRPGVTRSTLREFLRDSHNYPAAMNFAVEANHIRDLADYIVTMKKPGYKPAI